eukprot:s2317_g2.t2
MVACQEVKKQLGLVQRNGEAAASMKRALGCILSPFFPHENEKKITQCIRLFKKDPSSVAKDLLELNDVKGGTCKAIAEKLLRKLASRNLGEVDADWMKVLSTLGQDELSEDDKLTLTLIMAKKRQTEYLADNWESFCISEWLPAMEIKDIYDLFQELRKRGEAGRSPPKRRRRDSSGSSAPSGHSPAYAVGRHLADRLHEASSLEDLHRHRDILVSLYNMQEQPETMAELADWFQKNYAISDSCWAEEVDLTALDALLTTLSLNDCPLVCPFRTAMGDLAMAAGRRHQTEDKAAAAFRVAIGAEPTRQEAKVRLLEVLLRSQAHGDSINADEVVALMASTRNFAVDNFAALEDAFLKAMFSWKEEVSQELAKMLEETQQNSAAARVYMHLAKIVEAEGHKMSAYRYCRRAFRLRPGDSSLGGLLRLAPEVGCVQDAATEALKWRLPDAAEILGPIFEMFKAYVDQRLAAGVCSMPGGATTPRPRSQDTPSGMPMYDSLLENFFADDSQSSQAAVPVPATPISLPPGTPRNSAPGTPMLMSASQVADLRRKHPGLIPVVILPALDPTLAPQPEPNKYLVPIDSKISDLQRSLTKKIATWSAERKGAVLGSASELGHPLAPRQALSALDEQSGVECLQLRFTLDDGARVELFLGARRKARRRPAVDRRAAIARGALGATARAAEVAVRPRSTEPRRLAARKCRRRWLVCSPPGLRYSSPRPSSGPKRRKRLPRTLRRWQRGRPLRALQRPPLPWQPAVWLKPRAMPPETPRRRRQRRLTWRPIRTIADQWASSLAKVAAGRGIRTL